MSHNVLLKKKSLARDVNATGQATSSQLIANNYYLIHQSFPATAAYFFFL
jgi:hypothetical protein